MKKKVKKLIENKEVAAIKPRRIQKVQDARRLLASYIFHLQKGNTTAEEAKVMAYLLIKYAELYKIESLENIQMRLADLEEKVNDTTS